MFIPLSKDIHEESAEEESDSKKGAQKKQEDIVAGCQEKNPVSIESTKCTKEMYTVGK